jgi:Tfp pilus assembly PilM family ATPase
MRRCRSPIAIDFGEHRVKVLQLQRTGDRTVVSAAATAAVEPAPTAAAAPSPAATAAPARSASDAATRASATADDAARVARLLAAAKRALRAAPFRGDTARVALGLDAVATRHLRIPHDQLDRAGDRIAAKIAEPPAPPTEVAICPIPVSDLFDHGERMREFLCCVAPQPAIDRLLQLCEGSGLRPDGIDLEPLAQARALLRAHATESFVHVDVGASSTRMSIVRGGEPVLMRAVGAGGERVRQVLEARLGLDVASLVALAGRADTAAIERAVADALAETLEPIVRRVADGIRYCGTLFHGKAVTALRVTGQCAALPGLVPYLERRIGVAAEHVDLFAGLDAGPIPAGRRRDYATALGLALGGLPQ